MKFGFVFFRPAALASHLLSLYLPLVLLVLICCNLPAVSGQETALPPQVPGAAASACPADEPGSPLSAVKFYIVVGGHLETRTLTPDELAGGSFETDGYISGIVALGDRRSPLRVNGHPMRLAEPKADGTFSFGYYGRLKAEQLLSAAGDEKEDGGNMEAVRSRLSGATVYSYFPNVPADTISKEATFYIEKDTRDAPWRMEVRHNGGRKICGPPEADPGGGFVPFRYFGARRNLTGDSGNDLHLRMSAISQGIRNVESAFHTRLVDTVNILDFEEIHNAVTCLNKNDIWFYINTFRREPIHELSVIAEHEALHILVDRLNLTKNITVRKMFADLKGFDIFSMDRFRMVTQGQASPRSRFVKGEHGYFFDFISERNYLSGMKGGHPQEDLDEFCTSFLHTLMYMDRFEVNLEKFEGIGIQKKNRIIANYITLLGVLHQQFGTRAVPDGGAGSVPGIRFVSERVELLEGLDQQLQAANTRPESGE